MEIEELRQNAHGSSAAIANKGLEKLKLDYLQKLNALQLQVSLHFEKMRRVIS